MEKPGLPAPPSVGLGVADFKRSIATKLFYDLARFPAVATRNDNYMALAYTVRDRLLQRWVATVATYYQHQSRTVCYLSAEFLLGPHLGNNLLNLGLQDAAREALRGAGARPRRAARAGGGARPRQRRPRPPGRLLPRLAGHARDPRHRLRHPLRVRHLRPGDPRRLAGRGHRRVAALRQPLGDRPPRDRVRRSASAAAPSATHGRARPLPRRAGCPTRVVQGVRLRHAHPRLPASTPSTLLRLWQARRPPSRSTSRPSTSATTTARSRRRSSPRTSPRCSTPTTRPSSGKQLRLEQQYFFVSCSLQDMIRVYAAAGRPTSTRFADKVAIQLNDTHPAIAVAELMRLLVDEHGMDWDAGLGDHRAAPSATPTTPSCPRRSRSGRCRCSARCCRATSRSSTRSTAASSTRCARRYPGDDGARRAACRSSTRAGARSGAHGPPRRASAATPSTAWPRCTPSCSKRERAARLPRAVAGEVHQQDQRRHAAALRRPGQPAAWPRSSPSAIGDGWVTRPRASSRGLEPLRRRRRPSGREWRAVKRANKARLAERHPAPSRRRASTPTRSSTCRSSASTSTSAST